MSTPTLKTAIIEKKIWVAPQLTDEDIKSTNAGFLPFGGFETHAYHS